MDAARFASSSVRSSTIFAAFASVRGMSPVAAWRKIFGSGAGRVRAVIGSDTSKWTGGNMTGSGQTTTGGPLAITANFQELDTRALNVNGGATLGGAASNNLRGRNGALLSKEIVHAVTSLDEKHASVADLAEYARGQWGIESVHWLRDTAYEEDANTGYAGNGPQVMATLRNLAISVLYLSGVTEITRTLQAIGRDRNRVLDYLPL